MANFNNKFLKALDHFPIASYWYPVLDRALAEMDPIYLQNLLNDDHWLPGKQRIFAALAQPPQSIRFVLFGESPYPRAQSANGYAFWDAAVGSLWSENGLSKAVNRATSLRNIMKMLLIAEKLLKENNCSGEAIAQVDKTGLVQTIDDLFGNLLNHGFLLLNTSLVLSKQYKPQQEALFWRPLIRGILQHLHEHQPQCQLILFGKVASALNDIKFINDFPRLVSEHPYNLSFIHNKNVQQFFAPLHLLKKRKERDHG